MDLLKFGKKIKEPLPVVSITQSSCQATIATAAVAPDEQTTKVTNKDVFVRAPPHTRTNENGDSGGSGDSSGNGGSVVGDDKTTRNQDEEDNNLFLRQLCAALKYAVTMRFDDVSSTRATIAKRIKYRRNKYKNFPQQQTSTTSRIFSIFGSGSVSHDDLDIVANHDTNSYKDVMVVQEHSPSSADYLMGYSLPTKGHNSAADHLTSPSDSDGFNEEDHDEPTRINGQPMNEYWLNDKHDKADESDED